MNEDLRKILKQIYLTMRKDKIRFVKFCLDRGHARKDFAPVVGMTLDGLNKFIQRYIKEAK